MRKIQYHLLITCMLVLLCGLSAKAQYSLPAGKAPMIMLSTSTRSISYIKQSVCVDVMANVDYEVSSNVDWITIRRANGKIYFQVATNFSAEPRTGIVNVFNSASGVSRSVILTQAREGTAESLPTGDVAVSSASDNNHQSSSDITKTIDGNTSTIYHSQWGGGNVTPTNPAILTYNFNSKHIDYITYIPRTDGGNGCFGQLAVYYMLAGQTTYTLLGNYDFKKSGSPSTITLGQQGLDKVTSIKFVVYSGLNTESSTTSYASCAEMQFHTTYNLSSVYKVFGDSLLTTLRPGTTAEAIDTISNLFVKTLAQRIYDGTYSTKGRVFDLKCLLNVTALSERWSSPGKLYDQLYNPTGIVLTPGKSAIVASGIPDSANASLTVMGWQAEEGGGYTSESFSLHNGLNIINKTTTWNGLAYVVYNSYTPEKFGHIKVHFVNALSQGYLSNDKTNDEMQTLLDNAKYSIMDVVGDHVHSVWEVGALKQYTKGVYRRYINVLDTLITWEQRLIGLEKYNRIPENRTLAYVTYSGYMYQSGLGVAFHHDQQYRCCSPTKIMTGDDDVVWGLSHEWGHQHQMQPYFCWAGMSEVTNNMNSCYNVLHMGYDGSRVSKEWTKAKTEWVTDDIYAGKISQQREAAYAARSNYSWNPKMYAMFDAMKDSTIYARTTNVDRALGNTEVYVEETLAPFFMLHCYFSQNGVRDYSPDLYESLRTTDSDTDKYAMLASAQNGQDGRYAQLAAAYPTSCWITSNYVNTSSSTWMNSVPYIFNYIRKASKITGYNLYPFFEQWGFMRVVALSIGDYGTKYYCMTQEMKDEFKTDMDAMVTSGKLKELPSTMLNSISTANIPHFTTPTIPN